MLYGMATMHIRATFALDEPTTRGLAQLAKKWGVSKSEALRRAVAKAQEQPGPGGEMTPHDALRALQRKPLLSSGQARSWRADNARARRESEETAARAPSKTRKGTT
jgi:Arc/MetJ-type ribon-helix-helix transcriptional regulator